MKTFYALLAVIVLMASGFIIYEKAQPGQYDAFATCLKDKGAIFYGAFWCQHCQKQKAMFGKSAKLLPYVECSTSDAKNQLDVCKDKKIESYPTWDFSDGSREIGKITLEKLAEKTNCPLVIK